MTVEFEIRTLIDAPAQAVFDLARDIDVHTDSQGRREREFSNWPA